MVSPKKTNIFSKIVYTFLCFLALFWVKWHIFYRLGRSRCIYIYIATTVLPEENHFEQVKAQPSNICPTSLKSWGKRLTGLFWRVQNAFLSELLWKPSTMGWKLTLETNKKHETLGTSRCGITLRLLFQRFSTLGASDKILERSDFPQLPIFHIFVYLIISPHECSLGIPWMLCGAFCRNIGFMKYIKWSSNLPTFFIWFMSVAFLDASLTNNWFSFFFWLLH